MEQNERIAWAAARTLEIATGQQELCGLCGKYADRDLVRPIGGQQVCAYCEDHSN